MIEAKDFFDLKEYTYQEVFADLDFVWEALDRLKSYIKRNLVPNVTLPSHRMLPMTCVLWNGQVVQADFEIESGDATKGELKVFRKGEELPGASVLYGGAVLFDSNIYIGEGTVVEPGVLIKAHRS